MNTSLLLASFSTLATAQEAGEIWLQLLPAGQVAARDGRGPFLVGDGPSMQAITEATRNYAGSTELVVDYDHQTVFGAVPGTGGRAPAAGWIKSLEVRRDGIWGRVEWTAAAAQAIRAGEYRYLSPVFAFDKAGNVKLIKMAGLTNTPAFDLAQIAASTLLTETETKDTSMDEILAALGLPKGSDESKVVTAITAMSTLIALASTALGLPKDASSDAFSQAIGQAVQAKTSLETIAKAAGADSSATPDIMAASITAAIKAPANPDPARFVPIEQVAKLQTAVASMQAGLAEGKAEAAVEAALKAGKVAPATKDWALSYAKSDLAGFEAFAAAQPSFGAAQGRTVPASAAANGLDQSDTAVMSALGLSEDAFVAARKQETRN